MAERILVTGGAGYVGSVCVWHLLNKGYEVLIYDNLSTGHRSAIDRRARFVLGDLGESERLSRVFKEFRPDYVMHFAASCLVGESVEKPIDYYKNNVGNGISLISTMVKNGILGIVFSSSCSVYGEPVRIPMSEDDPKNPINPYGRTKRAFEQLLEDCDYAYGIKSVCLRYFNAAGAADSLGEDHSPETHLIPNVLRVVLGKTSLVKVFGNDYPTADGTCVRDYVHVIDLATAHEKAMELLRNKRSDRINLGIGKGFSVLEVIESASRVTGKKIPYEVVERRPGDPAVLIASAKRARDILGWKPEYCDLDRIIESAWKWHKEHPDGYRD
ncbi:MAG: UDP-glucose 4-epimerase GalE [bacterium]